MSARSFNKIKSRQFSLSAPYLVDLLKAGRNGRIGVDCLFQRPGYSFRYYFLRYIGYCYDTLSYLAILSGKDLLWPLLYSLKFRCFHGT